MEKLYVYRHPDGDSLFGLDHVDKSFEQASITDLRIDIAEQKRELELGIHPDGELCPWHDLVVVAEGRYIWHGCVSDYEMVTDDDVYIIELLDSLHARFDEEELPVKDIGTGIDRDYKDGPVLLLEITFEEDDEVMRLPFLLESVQAKPMQDFVEVTVKAVKKVIE